MEIQYKGLKATRKHHIVTDEMVMEELEQMRQNNPANVSIKDRPAQMGDNVILDFEGFIDGVAFEGGSARKQSLDLGRGMFIPGFEEGIVGHSIGEPFDIQVTFPEHYAHGFAGKEATFHCTIYQIHEKKILPLGDEFAKGAFQYDTLEELKEVVRSVLERRAAEATEAGVRQELLQNMIEQAGYTPSEKELTEGMKFGMRQFEKQLRMSNITMDDYLHQTGRTIDDIEEQLRPGVENGILVRNVLRYISVKEKIYPTPEELEQEGRKIAKQIGRTYEELMSDNQTDLAAEIANNMLAKKIMDQVVAWSEITEE